jgi:hypothetical protein
MSNMFALARDPRERSRFEYPDNSASMYDPVLRLRAGFEPGPTEPAEWWTKGTIGIHHDPELEAGRYSMPQPEYHPLEYEARKKMNWDFDRPVPFRSPRSVPLARIDYNIDYCGDIIRIKIFGNGYSFRSYQMRGSIERLNIPGVSNDVASMYVSVFKAYPGLRSLREDQFEPSRLASAQTTEICVTASALTEGLERSIADYPMVEPPLPGAQKPTGPRSGSDTSPHDAHEGWHCLARWPIRQ